jgi:hypothetical protein
MTVTLALTAEQEQRLARAAQGRGVDSALLLHQIVAGALAQLEPAGESLPGRVAGLHAGQYGMRDDFDTPLPDSFWTGGE